MFDSTRPTRRPSPEHVPWLEHPVEINPAEAQARRTRTQQALNIADEFLEILPWYAHLDRAVPDSPPGAVQRVLATTVKIGPAITGLLKIVRPPDITGSVRSVVIRPAIERAAIRPRPQQALNILDEQPDVMPAFADRDTTAAVSRIRPLPWVVAPGHHPGPGLIQRMRLPAVLRQPVSGVVPFPAETAARFGRGGFLPEISQLHLVHGAAIAEQPGSADARPVCSGYRDPYLFQHHAATEPVTGHKFTRRRIAHRFSPACRFRVRTGAVRCISTWRPDSPPVYQGVLPGEGGWSYAADARRCLRGFNE